jgi:hypothetical protein
VAFAFVIIFPFTISKSTAAGFFPDGMMQFSTALFQNRRNQRFAVIKRLCHSGFCASVSRFGAMDSGFLARFQRFSEKRVSNRRILPPATICLFNPFATCYPPGNGH